MSSGLQDVLRGVRSRCLADAVSSGPAGQSSAGVAAEATSRTGDAAAAALPLLATAGQPAVLVPLCAVLCVVEVRNDGQPAVLVSLCAVLCVVEVRHDGGKLGERGLKLLFWSGTGPGC